MKRWRDFSGGLYRRCVALPAFWNAHVWPTPVDTLRYAGRPWSAFRAYKPFMRKLWLALLFFIGGVSHELRHPLTCEAVSVRRQAFGGRRREGSGP